MTDKKRKRMKMTEERLQRVSDAIFYGRLSRVESVSMIPECSVGEVVVAPRAECMRAVVEAAQLMELKRHIGALSAFVTAWGDTHLKIILNLDESYGDEAGDGIRK